MDTRLFLDTVLGAGGYFCVWGNRLSDGRKVQKFYDSLDAVVHAAHNLDEEGFDAYYALGTFTDAESRKVPNVKCLKAFFLDLDCGPSKDYASQADAVSALRKFCKQLHLPKPTLVNSGRGIHVYWPLIESIERRIWVPIAERLKACCKAHNFLADPAVTSDAARVLRVPGTHNHKDKIPSEVVVIGEPSEPVDHITFNNLLGEEDFLNASNKPKYVPRESDAIMQALSGSFVSRFKTILTKTSDGRGCEQLREVVTNQANISEPMWRAGLSIAKHCADGAVAIHRISSKHPQYTPEATEEKASLIKGPYLCARFDEYRPDVCPNCSHCGKIKSPITLGNEVLEAEEEEVIVVETPLDIDSEVAVPLTYTIPKYPYPFFRGVTGGVFMHTKTKDDEDKDVLVYHNDLYVVRRIQDPEAGEVLVMRLHLPKDGVREFSIPLASVGSKEELRKTLAMHGVAVMDVQRIMEYTMKWVSELQYKTEATQARRQFGWTDAEGTSFALGRMEVFKDKIEVNNPSSATAQHFHMFDPKGTFDKWKKTMEFYNRKGMEMHQFVIGMSFGSPLMEFQPINAAMFHIYSKGSGLGKTTAMMAAMSVWGNPDVLMLKERDTFNSKMHRSEICRSILMAMDEMTNTRPVDLSDFAYQMPSGQQRNRLAGKDNKERFRGLPWKLLVCTTGNTSMIERIGLYKPMPEAEAQRILEYRARPMAFASKEETDVLVSDIKENYGHAGVVYLQYVMNNLAECIELANVVQRKIDVAAGLTAENRFWSALVSRTIAGLIIAKRAGLIDWDISAVSKWAIGVLQEAKQQSKEMGTDVEAILTDYLAENYNSILRIRSTDDARKGGDTGLDSIIVPVSSPRDSLKVRYEYDIKKLYLVLKPFKTWCGNQQYNYSAIMDGLKNGRTKAKMDKVRLSRGTHLVLPPVSVCVLDCSGFMDDETEQAMATNAALQSKPTEAE